MTIPVHLEPHRGTWRWIQDGTRKPLFCGKRFPTETEARSFLEQANRCAALNQWVERSHHEHHR